MSPAFDCCADFVCHAQHSTQIGAIAESALAGALNHRAVGHRIAEGHAEFDDIGASVNGGQRNVTRDVETGVAAGDVDDESGVVRELDGHG